jgi:hypothetical protein
VSSEHEKVQRPFPERKPLTEELRVEASPVRCPYCHAGLAPEATNWVACKACLARHHVPCWGEGGACSACGDTHFLISPEVKTAPEQLAPEQVTSYVHTGYYASLGLIIGGTLGAVAGGCFAGHLLGQDFDPRAAIIGFILAGVPGILRGVIHARKVLAREASAKRTLPHRPDENRLP